MRQNPSNSLFHIRSFLFSAGLILMVFLFGTCKKFEPSGFVHVETGDPSGPSFTYIFCTWAVSEVDGVDIESTGICYSTISGPTVSDSQNYISGVGSGAFTSVLSGLDPGTKYYYRAYASHGNKVTYGEEKSFQTLAGTGTAVTDVDGNVYQTIQIGDQLWMAENLRTTKYPDGSPINYMETPEAWTQMPNRAEVYCWYENDDSYRDHYGALYTWSAAVMGAEGSDGIPSGIQGVCPDGWHLPSDSEWAVLELELGMSPEEVEKLEWRGKSEYGGMLKYVSTNLWTEPNSGASNSTGFTALPGGYRDSEGVFGGLGDWGLFWSSSMRHEIGGIDLGGHRSLGYETYQIDRNFSDVNHAFSIRCVQGGLEGSPPIVGTTGPVNISSSSVTIGGEILSDGGLALVSKGMVWSSSSLPDVETNLGLIVDTTESANFFVTATGLRPGTTYYFRAFASNGIGTSYGNEIKVATDVEAEAVTDIDGNTYKTVQIGEQIWMAENLKTTHFADGSEIPHVDKTITWGGMSVDDQAYCWYENDASGNSEYGILYNWAAAMKGAVSSSANPSDVQGVCPAGWHLPSDDEWKQLEFSIGMTEEEVNDWMRRGNMGGKLKEAGYVHWQEPNVGATNETGFTSLASGKRDADGEFGQKGVLGAFWTATQSTTDSAIARLLHYSYDHILRYRPRKQRGFSVRCVKGEVSERQAILITGEVSVITTTTALCTGEVTDNGGFPVIQQGFCWNTTGNPTLDDRDGFVESGNNQGPFETGLTGLTPGTQYFVRAYAETGGGTFYGPQQSFSTLEGGTTYVTDIDGNVYRTVEIAGKNWMAENLMVTHLNDGTLLEEITEDTVWRDINFGAYCWYENDRTGNKEKYGALYNCYAVETQKLCPTGWHVPSDEEWQALETHAGMSTGVLNDWSWRGTDQGTKLKATSGWGSGLNGTDDYGFAAVPGGIRSTSGSYSYVIIGGFYWTSTEYSSSNGIYRVLAGEQTGVERSNIMKTAGTSIRCIAD